MPIRQFMSIAVGLAACGQVGASNADRIWFGGTIITVIAIHAQFIRPDQIATFKQYGIIPSFFTDHTYFFADTHVLNRGKEQAYFISPMKSAYETGLQPTNHTDAFVVPIDQILHEIEDTRIERNGVVFIA